MQLQFALNSVYFPLSFVRKTKRFERETEKKHKINEILSLEVKTQRVANTYLECSSVPVTHIRLEINGRFY